MLHVGDTVPDFRLPLAFADGRKDPVSFHELLAAGEGPLVVAFFPLAFTGTCTRELCEMRDQQAVFDHVGARVVGFSIDTPHTNVQFAKLHGLAHGIYSDPNREVIRHIWSTMTVVGVHDVGKRGWVVVTKDAKVAEKWITDVPGEWTGVAAIEAALGKLGAR